jgi:hypothetical protein
LSTEGDLGNEGSKIQRGTRLFDAVSGLSVGPAVIFSGRFVQHDNCLIERSFTTRGSMTDPEFEFIFSSLKPDS